MIKRLRVTVLGKTYDVTVETGGHESPSRVLPGTRPAAGAAPPAAPVSAPPESAPSPGDVLSPLAGKVVAIAAEKGKRVVPGDQLVTIEAMKMNTYVFAEKAGAITSIKVEVGQAVQEGQPLVSVA